MAVIWNKYSYHLSFVPIHWRYTNMGTTDTGFILYRLICYRKGSALTEDVCSSLFNQEPFLDHPHKEHRVLRSGIMGVCGSDSQVMSPLCPVCEVELQERSVSKNGFRFVPETPQSFRPLGLIAVRVPSSWVGLTARRGSWSGLHRSWWLGCPRTCSSSPESLLWWASGPEEWNNPNVKYGFDEGQSSGCICFWTLWDPYSDVYWRNEFNLYLIYVWLVH